jgi:glyoxylate/hydroxypyruvate reductase A
LHDFRQLKQYKQQQQIHLWQIYEPQKNPTVGFLGLGKIGEFVAQQCINLGFKTLAFTHQSKHKDIDCYHNEEGLKKVMSESNYLVCLLPLTPDTAGILNMKRFYYCKKHPLLIHVGRGEQLIEKDLFMALDKELIRQAVLDVFAIEPLPDGHIFWQRDDIIITPHNAARSDVQQTAEEIISLVNL